MASIRRFEEDHYEDQKMNNLLSLEMLRLITFLPLIIVLAAFLSEGRFDGLLSSPEPVGQIVSRLDDR